MGDTYRVASRSAEGFIGALCFAMSPYRVQATNAATSWSEVP